MNRRRRLGQHYLIDRSVTRDILELAAPREGERVLEIGTGRGALTRELVRCADALEAYELDRTSYLLVKHELAGSALIMHNADAFDESPKFDVLVSSLPYSESSRFIDWLSQRTYDRAVVVVQQEFARKLLSKPRGKDYRAVSVIAQASADIKVVSKIDRACFDPPPRVDSSLVLIKRKRTLTSHQVSLIKRIFSQKRRKVVVALKTLGEKLPVERLRDARVNELGPEAVMELISLSGGAAALNGPR